MTAHDALRADFLAVLEFGADTGVARGVQADRLVHLVVLHGLLPELESPPAGAPGFDAGPYDGEDSEGFENRSH